MRFLFAHYYHLLPQSISQPGIINYICYIIKAHGVGREKAHRMLEKYGADITLCPQCKQGRLVLVKVVYPKQGSVKLSPGVDAATAVCNKVSP